MADQPTLADILQGRVKSIRDALRERALNGPSRADMFQQLLMAFPGRSAFGAQIGRDAVLAGRGVPQAVTGGRPREGPPPGYGPWESPPEAVGGYDAWRRSSHGMIERDWYGMHRATPQTPYQSAANPLPQIMNQRQGRGGRSDIETMMRAGRVFDQQRARVESQTPYDQALARQQGNYPLQSIPGGRRDFRGLVPGNEN